jgi:hypothetical protein
MQQGFLGGIYFRTSSVDHGMEAVAWVVTRLADLDLRDTRGTEVHAE